MVAARRSLRHFPSRLFIAASTACLAFSSTASAVPRVDEQGTWQSMAVAPTKRTEVATAVADGKIYVIGGFAKPSISNILSISDAVEMYDPQTNQWSAKAALPTSLHHTGAVSVGGKLYVIGGFTRSFLAYWTPVATAYRYDPETDSWAELAAMPTPRGALAVAQVAGQVYAVGGIGEDGNSEAVEMYDPATNKWTTKAPLPTPRDHLAAAVVGGRLFTIGGRLNGSYSHNLDVTEIYDPAQDGWSIGAPLPTARSGIAAAVIGQRIYVVGGESTEGTFRTNEVYAPTSNRWYTATPMPTGRHGLGAAVVGGRLYVIAGGPSPGGSFSNLNERYDPELVKASGTTTGKASPQQVGTVMALLATFDDAGVLPPESTPEANLLIKALIQFQAAFMRSEDPAVKQLLVDALSQDGREELDTAVNTFRANGWTSYSLEAVVDYMADGRVWEDKGITDGFMAYNVGQADFRLLSDVFIKARAHFTSKQQDIHAVYAKRRREMPGWTDATKLSLLAM